jgi:hypothetical protein
MGTNLEELKTVIREACRQDINNEEILAKTLGCLDQWAALPDWNAQARDQFVDLLAPTIPRLNYLSPSAIVERLVAVGPQEGLGDSVSRILKTPDSAGRRNVIRNEVAKMEAGEAWVVLAGVLAHDPDDDNVYQACHTALQMGRSRADVLQALARNPASNAIEGSVYELVNRPGDSHELLLAWVGLPKKQQRRIRQSLAEGTRLTLQRELRYLFRDRAWPSVQFLTTFKGLADFLLVADDLDTRITRSFIQGESTRKAATRMWAEALPRRREDLPYLRALLAPISKEPLTRSFARVTGRCQLRTMGFEYTDVLRFDYLAKYAKDYDGRPLTRRGTFEGLELDGLIEQQLKWDDARDHAAQLRNELRQALQRLERRREGDATKRDDRELTGLLEELKEAELTLESSERFQLLKEASCTLINRFHESGVTWERFEPEGILGEYQHADGTATVYTGMIRITAAAPPMRSVGSRDEAFAAILAVAEIHEAAHGHLIDSADCDGGSWAGFKEAPFTLHEALATTLTRRIVEQQEDERVTAALNVLEDLLPPEYQIGRTLHGLRAERLRTFLLDVTQPSNQLRSVVEEAERLSAAARASAPLLAARFGEPDYDDLRELLSASQGKLLVADSDVREAEIAVGVFHTITAKWSGQIPLLAALTGVPWPSADDLVLWQLTAACRGPIVGSQALRLRLDWLQRGPGRHSALAGHDDLPNRPAMGLPDYHEAVRMLGYDADDPRYSLLAPRVPKKKAKIPGKR